MTDFIVIEDYSNDYKIDVTSYEYIQSTCQKNDMTANTQCRVIDEETRKSFQARYFSLDKNWNKQTYDYDYNISESFFDSLIPYLSMLGIYENTPVKKGDIICDDNDDNYNCGISNLKLIKYEEGGFFKKHSDGTNGDDIRFIFCLQPPEDGGEFVLYNDDDTIAKEVKLEKNMLILFKPNIQHEAKPVIKGAKYILTGNIYKSCEPLGWHRMYMTGED